MAARKLRNAIGMIVNTYSSTYNDLLLDSLSKRFHDEGYQVYVLSTNGNVEWEREAYTSLSKLCDCIFAVSSARHYSEIEDVVPKQIPVIFMINKPEDSPHTAILSSDYSAAYQGIISLATHYNRRVACVCESMDLDTTKECIRAYVDAVTVATTQTPEDYIYEVKDLSQFVPRKLIHDIRQQKGNAVFVTSPALSAILVDYLAFHNSNPKHTPIAMLGYGYFDSGLTSAMHIDLIDHPVEQAVDLAFQHATYAIHHSKSENKRVFLLKGILHTHTLNGLKMEDLLQD